MNNIKFKFEFIFVMTDTKIYIYDFFDNLTLSKEIDTAYNPNGMIESNAVNSPFMFAYISPPTDANG